MDVDISLDMISFVGRPKDWPAAECELFLWSEEDSVNCVRRPGLDFHEDYSRWIENYSLDGAYISCHMRDGMVRGRDAESGVQFGAEVDLRVEHPLRIEFNPNKVTSRVLTWLRKYMIVEKVTRADVAIDYSGLSIEDCLFRRPRVKPQLHYMPEFRGLQGLYLGSRASDRFVRVYDKAAELGLSQVNVTRVEGVGRHRYVLDPKLFDGLMAYRPAIPMYLSADEAGMLALYLHAPEHFGRLDRRTRKKYRDLASESLPTLSPMPADVYRDHAVELVKNVDALRQGDPVPVAKVYQ